MRDTAGQLADRFHLLQLRHRRPTLVQRFLLAATLGDVAHDLGETAQIPVRLAQRGNDGARPKARAVLADPPTFLLRAAGGRRNFEQMLRRASRSLLGRKEAGEMTADDFVGSIAADPFGALVPAGDVARRIEHEDGIVAHT